MGEVLTRCEDCQTRLTPEEQHYIETKCSKCAEAWSNRMDAWRHGRIEEPELDAFYSAPLPHTEG